MACNHELACCAEVARHQCRGKLAYALIFGYHMARSRSHNRVDEAIYTLHICQTQWADFAFGYRTLGNKSEAKP